MREELEKQEHLISRYLDGECTAVECDALEAMIADDPHMANLFESYRKIDHDVGKALRHIIGRSQRTMPIRAIWPRVGKGLTVAAAACLAALAWLHPTQRPSNPGPTPVHKAGAMQSWFAPFASGGDAVEEVPAAYEQPEVRVRGTQRDWIVFPGNEPGTYLVIEVDRVRTHAVAIHQDF